MHDLIFAVAFVAMVASPAMVAAIGGRKEFDPGPTAPAIRSRPAAPSISVRPSVSPSVRPSVSPSVPPFAPTLRPRTARKVALEHQHYVIADGPTLPMRNARGMANR